MQMFLDECEYLIHLVRCTIHDLQPQELPEGLDFERVYGWGVYHHVANIAFYSVEKLALKPEAQLYGKWQACRDRAIVLDINQSYGAQQVREAFAKGGVRYLEVQGTKVKPFYPQPSWRTMSDIDFIVEPQKLSEAAHILETLGYRCREERPGEVFAHYPPSINIELHTEYFMENYEYRKILHSPFGSVDENGQCGPETLYLYNIAHIAKHYFKGGCGIRRVLDVYFLNEKLGAVIDRSQIRRALEPVNGAQFYDELQSLADAWFSKEGQSFPRTEMAAYIVNSGLHGNRPNELKHQLEKTFDNTLRFAKLRYFLRRFWGSGGQLRKKYPILERHKILYPLCWLHRSFRALQPQRFKRIRKEAEAVLKKNKA